MNAETFHGIVEGDRVQLPERSRFPVGTRVQITLILEADITSDEKLPPGEGLRRTYGAWADDAEDLDAFIEWSRQQRKIERKLEEP